MNNFDKLPLAVQEQHLLNLANQSLCAWHLQGELRLIKQRENAVYELRTNDDQRFALRIHRANYHSNDSLDSEFNWLQALDAHGIGVPTMVPTIDGNRFTIVDNELMDAPRQVDLLQWIDGDQIGSIENGLDNNPEKVEYIFTTIGEIAARVHNQATNWALPNNFERHAWDTDGLVGDQPLWGRFWELEALTSEERNLVIKGRDALRADLENFGQSSQSYSMIHADFAPENVMINGDQIHIIDFDDAGFGWHLFELATALYFIQGDKNYPVAKAALIKGYRSQRELSDEQLARLPMFFAARGTSYLGWVHTRQGTQTSIEMTPMLVEMCCTAISDYLHSR